MTRLDRYILARLFGVFALLALVLIGVAWVGRAMELFERVVGDGHSMGIFVQFTVFSLPALLQDMLPITAFVVSVRATLALLGSNELAAAQAAGLSPLRLARPVLYFGLTLGAFLAVLMHGLLPAAHGQRAALQAEVAQNITSALLQPGVFQHPADGLTVFISEIAEDGTLTGVFISDQSSSSDRIDYTASRALLVVERTGPKLVMIDGFAQIYNQRSGRLFTTTFSDFTYDLGEQGPGALRRNLRELSTRELLNPTEALLAETRASTSRALHELASRFTEPMMPIIWALLGFSVLIAARFSRLGFWRPVMGAVVIMALMAAMNNTIDGVVMRDKGLIWMMGLPPLLGLGVVFSILLWAGRRRHRRWLPSLLARTERS